MSKPLKYSLLAVGALIGILVLAALILLPMLAANSTKLAQTFASEALGMEVSMDDHPGIGFFPSLHLALENVRIRNRGAEVASAAQALLGIELLALLRNEIRMDRVELRHVRISVERQRDGSFNLETRGKPVATLLTAEVAKVSLSDAKLVYADQQTGKGFEANSCSLDVQHLRSSRKQGASPLTGLSFNAALACGEVRAKDLVLSDLQSSIEGKDGVFDLKPITMRAFGGQGTGDIRADFSGSVPGYQVRYALSKFQLAEFFKTFSPRKVGSGLLDFSANLSMQGRTTEELDRSAGGEASLRGHDLTLEIGDIDKTFARYESSQNFNLVDVGAVLIAGPLALVVTRGYSFARILGDSGGTSHVRTLVSEWKVERGVAQAKDVAMATQRNRVALQGELDFVNERFKDVTVAVIDSKGCATVQQKIRGPFAKPEVQEPSVMASITGPVGNLLAEARNLLGGHCNVFYAGSVAAPVSSTP